MAELTSRFPADLNAWHIASLTFFPVSGSLTIATAVGPAPLMVHPCAPAALAASLTAIRPGMRGPLTGSTMTSESSACPNNCESPFRMPATRDPPWQQLLMSDFIGTSFGRTARIALVGASKTGLTSTKYRLSLPPYGSCSSCSGSPGVQLLMRMKPPMRDGPTLSAWYPDTAASASSPARMSSRLLSAASPKRPFTAHAAAAALAAEEPRPEPKGSPFWSVRDTPQDTLPINFNVSAAAMPMQFLVGSRVSLPLSPSILSISTWPGLSGSTRATTTSPPPSTAQPIQS
mmetsp:Transcript_15578/g.42286  ORF Transcript_15578/g.42286 Transcript_15578/m.42286 type:complete len:289 (+) Transcript_15578:232-1098(+)